MDTPSITQFLNERILDLVAVYQFGSQARGTARPTSDIDLAVLSANPIPAEQIFHLAQELAICLHRDVDLVDLRSASTVMRMQVLTTGQCLGTKTFKQRLSSKCTPTPTMRDSTRSGATW